MKRNTRRKNVRKRRLKTIIKKTTVKKRRGGNVDQTANNVIQTANNVDQTANDVIQTAKNEVTCNLLDTKLKTKLNQLWRTCITANNKKNDIFYFTPNNVVIKSIETFQIPEFVVKIGNFDGKCKIKIEDKYVASFLFIDDRWYAMMRLFGTTINTGVIARPERNKAFYLLDKEVMNPPGNPEQFGLIVLDPSYTQLPVIERTWFSTSNNNTIVIDKGFTQITKENALETFNVLYWFRIQKVVGNTAKYELAETAVSSVFDVMKSYLGQ
jgi:hypothetical protein